jgi:metal-sulfur cluster biosynthetic enzyme
MAERRQSLVVRGVSVESVMVPPWETSWMARAGSRIGAAVTQDNAAGRVNVPSVQRLNHCHVD